MPTWGDKLWFIEYACLFFIIVRHRAIALIGGFRSSPESLGPIENRVVARGGRLIRFTS